MSRIIAAVLAAALCSTQVAAQDAPPARASVKPFQLDVFWILTEVVTIWRVESNVA